MTMCGRGLVSPDRPLSVLASAEQHCANIDWLLCDPRECLGFRTVHGEVSNSFGTLQVADRVQAALRAREAGLG